MGGYVVPGAGGAIGGITGVLPGIGGGPVGWGNDVGEVVGVLTGIVGFGIAVLLIAPILRQVGAGIDAQYPLWGHESHQNVGNPEARGSAAPDSRPRAEALATGSNGQG